MAGFQPRRLTATPTASRHSLGVRFDDLKPGGTYHLTVWLKSAPNAWAMVEGRDSNDPATGRPPHYGVASYNLAQSVMTTSSGDLANPNAASAKNGWVKATFDLKTKDGHIFVTANLLEGSNGLMNFQGAGQSVVFGELRSKSGSSGGSDRPSACTALASRLQKDQVSGPLLFSTSRKAVTFPSAASEGSAAASGRDSKAWLASCSAFAVALLLLAAMLSTLFEKNLVNTLTQQGWTRELYAISAALTKTAVWNRRLCRRPANLCHPRGGGPRAEIRPPSWTCGFPTIFAMRSCCSRRCSGRRPSICRRRRLPMSTATTSISSAFPERTPGSAPILTSRSGFLG